jgi:hypothetical protein
VKQSDPLQLVNEGTLEPPGPVGRLVRMSLGFACFYALYVLVLHIQSIIQTPVSVLPNIALLVFAAIIIINYVINIGFGKSWGRWPSYFSIGAALLLALIGWLVFGTADHPLFGAALWAWLMYFFAHLGVSFVLSAIIATPGCEMRAIPHLFGKISGRAVAEHHCPASFITKIDAWESKR